MDQNKEDGIIKKRFIELAYFSYNKGISIFSDFLNINEISLLYSIKQELPDINYKLWGGYANAERRVVCFYTDDSFHNALFPIECIKIEPCNKKFCDELTHRDYLGAILNLGIERTTIGDILIREVECFVFCNKKISSYIVENLTKIKHTNVKSRIECTEDVEIVPKWKEIKGTVSSKRIDAVLAVAFQTSRSSLAELFNNKRVYVNSRLTESNSYILKEDDIVSVRGMGKFVFQDNDNITKKGRFSITIKKYI